MTEQKQSLATAATEREASYQSNHWKLNDTPDTLIKAMCSAGIEPKNLADVVLNGTIQRFAIKGDKPGRDSGWLIGHNDSRPAARFGSHRLGIERSWRANRNTPITASERADMARRQAEREAQQERAHKDAAKHAASIRSESNPADAGHGYLIKKGVEPHNARQKDDRLVLPLFDFDGHLWSLQFIGPDGDKKLLKGGKKSGCFIPVAGTAPPARILICEGWATGATLAEHDPDALVLAAVDAGNLKAVATGARNKWPDAEIVVCADADPVGREKGRAASIAADALLALPDFPSDAQGSDFNDLAALQAGGAP